MSTTIDERVVEMRFDNKQFESNVKTSMSTIDKLKSSLNFSGASKGLESVNTAAKNVNMSGLGSAVETVKLKFSALEVMAVTALANITNSAVNTGKKLLSALTIDPIKSGFSEYETQINAVQTILANTESKGTTLDDVNAALDTLNTYADKTIYNFTEMTRNIGTFTAAGVDLDTSVSAIQGIANLAAVSGSTSAQASTAMYQLSQAIANGTVNLQDWNSVVNAGMGGEVFQNALIETAAAMQGISEEAFRAQNITGSFRESIGSQSGTGWLNSDILLATLRHFTMAAEEGTEQWEEFKKSLMEEGFSESQAEEILKMANTATDAATKVKTFTQLIDTTKEALQSGWTQSWEIIIGDFEEAKSLWTEVSDALGAMINKSAESRNALLQDALGSKWTELTEQINEAGVSTDEFKEKLKEVASEGGIDLDALVEECGSLEKAFSSGKLSTDLIAKTLRKFAGASTEATESTEDLNEKLAYFQDVVDRVWKGEFKNAPERYQMLAEAGYDYKVVQDLVNKTVDGHRLTLEDLSDTQLKSIGYTEEEISAIRKLADEAEKAGTPLNELIKSLEKPSGRELLIESFRNILSNIVNMASSVKKAWDSIFPAMTSDQLYDLIAGFNAFTESIVIDQYKLDQLTRTFEGLFAAIDIVATITGSGLKIAFEAVKQVLEYFDMDILTLTTRIAGYIIQARNWIDEHNILADGLAALIPLVVKAAEAISNLLKAINDSGAFSKFVEQLSPAATAMLEWVKGLKDADSIPQYIISGLIKGFTEGIPLVANAVLQLGKTILFTICDFLGIASPSKEMTDVGLYTAEGLGNGVEEGADSFLSKAIEKIKGFFTGIIDFIKNIDFGAIFAVAIAGGLVLSIKKISDAFSVLASPFEGLGSLFENLGESVKTLSKGLTKNLKAKALESKSQAILNLAIAVGILAASVFILTKVEDGKLWGAVGAIGAITGIIVALAAVSILITKMGSFGKMSLSLMGIGVALLLIVGIAKILSGMTWGDMGKAAAGFGGLLAVIALLMTIALIPAKEVNSLSTTLIKMAIALGIFAVVAKLIATMTANDLRRAAVGFTVILAVIALLMTIALIPAKDVSQVTSTLISIAAALAVLALVAKVIATMEGEDFIQGAVGLVGLAVIVNLLVKIVSQASKDTPKIVSTLLGIAAAMAILTAIGAVIGLMSWPGIAKAAVGLAGLAVIVNMLVTTVDRVGKDAPKIAGTLIGISVAIGILAAVAIMLSIIKIGGLLKGVIAVGALAYIAEGLIHAASYAKKGSTSSIIALSVAIAVMAAALAVLTLVNTGKLLVSMIALYAVMSAFAVVLKQMKGMQGSVGVLVTFAVIIALLSAAMIALANLPVAGVLAASAGLSVALIAFSGMMYILSLALKNMTGTLKGAVSFGVMMISLAAAVLILSKSLSAFTSVEWGDLGKAAATLAGVLVIMGVASAILEPLGGTLLVVSGSLLIFSAGLLVLANAIATLASIGPSGALTLTMLATTILNLIPYAIQKLGEGVVAFAQVIITAAPVIAAAVVTVLTTIITAVTTTAPLIVTSIIMMLTLLLTTLSIFVPQFVNAGMNLLVGVLKGIADHIGDVVTTAITIVVNFLNAVAEKLPDVIQAGFNLILAFITGLGDAIEGNTDAMLEAIKKLFTSIINAAEKVLTDAIPALKTVGSKIINSGLVKGIKDKVSSLVKAVTGLIGKAKKAITDKIESWKTAGKNLIGGFIQGIKDKTSDLVESAKGVVDSALQGAKNLLGINSPSKEFAKLGMYSDEGMILGLTKYAGGVTDAAKSVGRGALDAMTTAISSIADSIDSDMDLTPTIRPVVDLTDVESGTKSISDIFNRSRTINVDSASVRAASIARDMDVNSPNSAANQNGAQFSFTQNNYSPKSLSKVDIYRQTKNQFSALKGVLKKA